MVPQDQDARSRLLELVEKQALAVRENTKKPPEPLHAAVQLDVKWGFQLGAAIRSQTHAEPL
jgi:hypothetical protein